MSFIGFGKLKKHFALKNISRCKCSELLISCDLIDYNTVPRFKLSYRRKRLHYYNCKERMTRGN